MRMSSGLLLAALGAAGCNRYDFFNVAGYEQTTFSNKADIIFVIDNSSSMADEATSLALNFDNFIGNLTSAEGTPPTDDLSDAVDNYTTFVTDRGRVLDYQLAITTTTVDYASNGATSAADPGEAGRLLGDPTIISKDSASVADSFIQNLMCEATCWSTSAVEDDPSYSCGTDPGGVISTQYLDCLCGEDAWRDHCGSGTEEHLEAVLDTLCRAAAEAPELCWDETISPLTEEDAHSTTGLLREDSTPVVVIVTDEGDSSRRMSLGEEDPTDTYLAYYDEFDLPLRVAVIGPDYDPDTNDFSCNSGGATNYGTLRLQAIAAGTDSFYNYIEEMEGGSCATTDFSVHLNDLGELLNTLLRVFQLASIPDTSTIRVYVDGDEIAEAIAVEDDIGNLSYDDGWSYDPSQNAVVFWGDAIPDYNQDVRIYYLPLEGKPRELPF